MKLKRICCVVLSILCSLSFVGCCDSEAQDFFASLNSDVTKHPAIAYNSEISGGGYRIDTSDLIGKDYTPVFVYELGERVYFVYGDITWYIASILKSGEEYTIHAQQAFSKRFHSGTIGTSNPTKQLFCENGTIYLYDGTWILEYNIFLDSAVLHEQKQYTLPNPNCSAKRNTQKQELEITLSTERRVLTREYLKDHGSEAVVSIVEFAERRPDTLNYFFGLPGVQQLGETLFLEIIVYDKWSNRFDVFLQYDWETEEVSYLTHLYTGGDDSCVLYLVPTIG